VITPDDVFEVLEADVKAADLILWVGISFEQSASTAYFRRVRSYLQARPARARRRRGLCCVSCRHGLAFRAAGLALMHVR